MVDRQNLRGEGEEIMGHLRNPVRSGLTSGFQQLTGFRDPGGGKAECTGRHPG